MATRRLLSPSVRDILLGIPSDTTSLERNHVLADEDLGLIGTRRRAANRLGLAVHIALLRHPGQGWLEDTNLPGPLLLWLAEQIAVPVSVLTAYGIRGATRTSHRQLAMRHLGLQPFVPRDDMATAIELAARAAFDTDDGRLILERLTQTIRNWLRQADLVEGRRDDGLRAVTIIGVESATGAIAVDRWG